MSIVQNFTNVFFDILKLLFPDVQTYWVAIASIGTVSAVLVALQPLIEKVRIGRALFNSALSVQIFPDGVFQIQNLFDEPINIQSISQRLYCGSEIGFMKKQYEEIIYVKTKKPDRKFSVNKLNKYLAPKQFIIYPNSKTHIEGGTEKEAIWVVETIIEYKSTRKKHHKINLIHRFSHFIEPRSRWVEEITLTLGEVLEY